MRVTKRDRERGRERGRGRQLAARNAVLPVPRINHTHRCPVGTHKKRSDTAPALSVSLPARRLCVCVGVLVRVCVCE